MEDDSFAFDTKSSVGRLEGVDAQVVETRADVKSKCHKKVRKTMIKSMVD